MTSDRITYLHGHLDVSGAGDNDETDEEGESPSNRCKTMSASDITTQLLEIAQVYLSHDDCKKFEEKLNAQSLAIRIGAALLRYRRAKGLSVAQVALQGGLSKVALYNLEGSSGSRGPRISSVQKYLRGMDAQLILGFKAASGGRSNIVIDRASRPEDVSATAVLLMRNMADLNQSQVERLLSSPSGLLSRIEKQRQSAVSLGTITKIAAACGVTFEDIKVIDE